VNICCVFVGDISFEIKTEADSNDITQYARDDMPSTGMIVFHYECILCVPRLFWCLCHSITCIRINDVCGTFREMYLYVCILICPSVELKVKVVLECHREHGPGLHVYFTAFTSTKLYCLASKAVDCLEHRRGASTPIGHWLSSFKTGTPIISFGVSVWVKKTVDMIGVPVLGANLYTAG